MTAPDRLVCQCYPEGRNDCPKHRECIERLGPGQTHGWPTGCPEPIDAALSQEG